MNTATFFGAMIGSAIGSFIGVLGGIVIFAHLFLPPVLGDRQLPGQFAPMPMAPPMQQEAPAKVAPPQP